MESEKPCLVLIVEDLASTETVANALNQRGYVSASFQDPHRALEYLSINTDRADLIIADTEISGMGGVEMAKRAVAINPHISIILLYGRGEHHPQTASLPNIRSMLQKPVSEKDLMQAVEGIIQKCGLLPEKRRY
jgi:two-component SAPR family response regulator